MLCRCDAAVQVPPHVSARPYPQDMVRGLPEARQLYRFLINGLSSEDFQVIICSLSVLARFGEKHHCVTV